MQSTFHILVIEDNQIIANNISDMLRIQGFLVDVSYSGDEGLEKAKHFPYACIVLDIMLPGVNGIEICHKLRETKHTPIIMMTAKGELDDKAEGFEAGADDYIVKPFALKELVMRINAILKRTELPNTLSYGNLTLDLYTQELHNDTQSISLPLKEFLLLEYLMQRKEKAISRTELIEYVRGGEAREHDANLDVYIANLRRKIRLPLIQTIKGFGYMFSNKE